MAGKATDKWVTLGFLMLLFFAALTAHTGALTITSSDTVSVSTKDTKGTTSWTALAAGDIASVELAKPTAVKLTLTSATDAKQKVEPVIQVNTDADLVVQADYAAKEIRVVQVGKDRIEGYYSYGKSSTYPWGFYWCVHLGEKPLMVYSEFSGRKVWYNYVGQKTVDTLTATIEKGELPDISIIQAAVGA